MNKHALTWAMLLSAVFANQPFQQTFKTEDFEAPKMRITRLGITEPGYLFFGTLESGHQAPIIMTDEGDLIWEGPDSAPHNFKVQDYNGEKVLTYFTGAQDPFGHGYGKVIIVDNTYNVINTVCIENSTHNTFVTPNPAVAPGKDPTFCYVDYHESFITPQGTILLTAFNVTRADLRVFNGPKDGWIFDWLFYEVDIATQNILFRWRALDHIDITKSNYQQDGSLNFTGQDFGTTQAEPWDFFHGNSVSTIPGGYLINSRMTWSCYKIDGKTGQVVWTLEGSNGGDFKLEDPVPYFAWQHMPRSVQLHGDTDTKFQIQLFNNNNIRNVQSLHINASSGYLLNVDTENMRVSVARHLQSELVPPFAVAQGSYQALQNGHVLLGYGSQPYIDEFDADNKMIYRAQFASEKGRAAHSYRAYRQHWHGFPTSPPKVAGIGTNFYASWNGATDYDGWNFYGLSDDMLILVWSNVPRIGFETMIGFPKGSTGFTHVMAEATLNGTGLANSSVELTS